MHGVLLTSELDGLDSISLYLETRSAPLMAARVHEAPRFWARTLASAPLVIGAVEGRL